LRRVWVCVVDDSAVLACCGMSMVWTGLNRASARGTYGYRHV
jgi:hypothetical protein